MQDLTFPVLYTLFENTSKSSASPVPRCRRLARTRGMQSTLGEPRAPGPHPLAGPLSLSTLQSASLKQMVALYFSHLIVPSPVEVFTHSHITVPQHTAPLTWVSNPFSTEPLFRSGSPSPAGSCSPCDFRGIWLG